MRHESALTFIAAFALPLILLAAGCSNREESISRDVEREAIPEETTPEQRAQAEKLYHEGLKLEEQQRMHEALAKWKEALTLDGRNFPLVNHTAWFLAVSSPPELRDHKAALPLARRAVRLSRWKENNVIDTLAEVYFLHGKYQRAIATQKRALLPGVRGGCSASYLRRQIRKYEAAYVEYKRAPFQLENERAAE
ncbi:MAG TPA: hypothetical protein VEJ63_18890 [Planctomycetota bacterium]|nr:hypothetical protein [Planctomycetota bacterium]